MSTLKCIQCSTSITRPHSNALTLAHETPGWVAWLNGSCETQGLCPQHSTPFAASIALLYSTLQGSSNARQVTISTIAMGPPPPKEERSVDVDIVATCKICGESWSTTAHADPLTLARRCADQVPPVKPSWFDRVAKKGVYAYGEYGICSIKVGNSRLQPCPGEWFIRNRDGRHVWAWRCRAPYTLFYCDSPLGGEDTLPIEAVDPEVGWNYGRCRQDPSDQLELWRTLAKGHYGIQNPKLPGSP